MLRAFPASVLLPGGCNASVGAGVGTGLPIGDHGFMRAGTGRWR